MTAIAGNTYPVRRELRAMGGQWDATKKVWYVPDEKATEASALTRGKCAPARRIPRLEKRGSGRGYLGTDRYGSAHFGTPCRCEDYPCCGH